MTEQEDTPLHRRMSELRDKYNSYRDQVMENLPDFVDRSTTPNAKYTFDIFIGRFNVLEAGPPWSGMQDIYFEGSFSKYSRPDGLRGRGDVSLSDFTKEDQATILEESIKLLDHFDSHLEPILLGEEQ